MSDIKEFKQELKELLEKYKVSLDFECSPCSDLHGVYDARITANFWGTGESYDLSEGYGVGVGDLKR